MAGRGATTFQKRQKEMQRKERQQEKFAKRMERKKQSGAERPFGADDITDDIQAAAEGTDPAEAWYPKGEV
jgi:hypothetical protein